MQGAQERGNTSSFCDGVVRGCEGVQQQPCPIHGSHCNVNRLGRASTMRRATSGQVTQRSWCSDRPRRLRVKWRMLAASRRSTARCTRLYSQYAPKMARYVRHSAVHSVMPPASGRRLIAACAAPCGASGLRGRRRVHPGVLPVRVAGRPGMSRRSTSHSKAPLASACRVGANARVQVWIKQL